MTQKLVIGATAVIIVFTLVIAGSGSAGDKVKKSRPSLECEEVITLANQVLAEKIQDPGNYKLIKIQNMVFHGSEYIGPDVWRITYKDRKVIARGKGGEVFIEVNFKEKKGKLLGYGE